MTLLTDLKFAVRHLRLRPGFTAAAVSVLALGLGAVTALFSVADGVVLRPLPYQRPDELVTLFETNLSQGLDRQGVSPVNFLDYRAEGRAFADLAAWWSPQINLTDREGEPIRVETIEVSRNFFALLGVEAKLGRTFVADPEIFDREAPELVIGWDLFQRRYGGHGDVVGSTVALNGEPATIVGVAPPGFRFPGETEVWQGLDWDFAHHSRFAHFLGAVGRLRPGLALAAAQAELDGVTARLASENAPSNKEIRAVIAPLDREILGEARPALLALLGAVGLLLLLACANVANLLLARATSREREIAVRMALGAGRRRLLAQLLTESLVLAAAGCLAGLGLAWAALRLFRAAPPLDLPRLDQVALDGRVLLVAAAATVMTALLCGLAPALRLASRSLQDRLREGGHGGGCGGRGRAVRSVLVVAEVALAVVLLVGAGLLVRSFLALLAEDPGFRREGVVTAHVMLPASTYEDWDAVGAFFDRLRDAVGTRPGVAQVGAASFLPLEPGWRIGYGLPDRAPPPEGETPVAQYVSVTPGYFEAMGIPLLEGRRFESADTATSYAATVVSEELARRSWPAGEAVGKGLQSPVWGIGPIARAVERGPREYRVVGVVGDVRNRALGAASEPTVYLVQSQFRSRSMRVVVRGEGDPARLVSLLRDEVRRLDPGLALADVRTLEEVLDAATAPPRFFSLLMTSFATLALVLAAVGIYGVLAFVVGERRREIGVRLALGASPLQVLRQVVGEGMLLAATGTVAGAAGAFYLARVLASILHGVGVADPVSFALAVVTVLAVALVACALPGLKAARVDPVGALRSE